MYYEVTKFICFVPYFVHIIRIHVYMLGELQNIYYKVELAGYQY